MLNDGAEVRRPCGELFGHPRGLWYLAFSETWERFSYYGMQTLLILYMAGQLLKPGHVEHVIGFAGFRAMLTAVYGPLSVAAEASIIFGLYTGMVYLTPIAGGWIADRLLGRSRTIMLGGTLMAAGHFLLAFDAPFLIALGFLVLGTGCFKGNIASQVGGLYKAADMRRSAAFQIYYLGISAGAILAPLVCGTLGEVYGWHYGFAAAGVGMLVGLAIYVSGRNYLGSEAPRVSRAEAAPLTRAERTALWVLIGMLPVLTTAMVGNQQIFNAYLLWGQQSYDFMLFGVRLPTTWLIALDAAASIVFLALTVAFWRLWARRFKEPHEITKMVIGSLFTVAAFLMLAAAAVSAGPGEISLLWAVGFHCINSIAFANIAPVGLSLYARMAPAKLSATVIGIFYIHLFLANNLVGWLGSLLERMDPAAFWLLHAGIAGLSTALLLLFKALFRGVLEGTGTPSSNMTTSGR